jgi:hypothetical protein
MEVNRRKKFLAVLARETELLLCVVLEKFSLIKPQVIFDVGRLGRTPTILNVSQSLPVCIQKQAPWHESASELHRPSDRRLSVKLVPTLADRGCYAVSVTDPYGRIRGFLDRSRYFFFQVAPQLYSQPIAVGERSKARTVFARSNTAIVGSNPT